MLKEQSGKCYDGSTHSQIQRRNHIQQCGHSEMVDCSEKMASRQRKSGVRVFKSVESLTNQLVATDKNFQAMYDAVMIQLVLYIFYFIIRGSIKAQRLHLDATMLFIGLGSNYILITMELYLLSSFLLVYPCFQLWIVLYHTAIPSSIIACLFIFLFVSYVLSSGAIVAWTALSTPLPSFSTIILSMEQLRLSMKSYSFIRENAYKVLYPWHKDDKTGAAVWYAGQMSPQVGSFSSYVYFLFSPTLLYRDHYPRNKGPIKWKNVIIYFTQFITTIWYLGLIAKDFTFPSSMRTSDLVQCYINSLMCAFFGFVLVHTCIFHGYMNFVAELLRFADREFYQDWWTSTTFSSYYRKWNTIVHDWIHSYLYTDMKSIFHSPLLAVFATIFASAFVHEYLLALALRFASPVLLLEFAGLGVIFYLMRPFSKRRVSNLFVLIALSLGGANLIFYYQVELAARLYCPEELNWVTFFKPRLFECFSKHNSSLV